MLKVASYLLSCFPLFYRFVLVYCLVCRAKRKTDYPPNVLCIEECELQHLKMGPGNHDAEWCSSGGCDTDRTSTTSFPETTSSNVGELEPQTAPIRPHAESGQQGAISHPLSKRTRFPTIILSLVLNNFINNMSQGIQTTGTRMIWTRRYTNLR